MTPQEAQMLQDLVRKVEGAQLTEKDPDAEALLNDGLARDPDALYKLAQTVLIQNMALDQARTQMQRMQQQQLAAPPQPAKATSFLGGLFHSHAPQPNAPQYAPPPPPQYQAAPPNYPPPPPAYGGGGYAPSGGGFLRSAATTAAGVAGGMLAVQGIESLFHGAMGGFGGGGFGGGAPGETVINNYYDDPASQQMGDTGALQGGPDEQPQGPYDASSNIGGPDEQPQGPYDDSGSDQASDSGGDAQSYVDDSGGGDFGGDTGGGDVGSGGDFGS